MTTPPDHAAVPVLSFAPGAGLLPIDLTEMYRANTFIQGATRAGKSWMLRFLMEQLFGRVQQMVFDTEGEYASLTEKFDYALFSLETPVQALPANAPLLIRRLLDMGTSAIFDLSDLSTTDQQEFVRLATGRSRRRPLGLRRPVTVNETQSTKKTGAAVTTASPRRKRTFTMHSVPDPTPIPSDPAPGPRLIITPDGLEIYHDLRRNKLFVTFHYRRDKPVRLATVYAWIGELLDDIAQAGLLVRGPLTVLLSPQSVDQATSQSAFTASLKVEVRPRAEEAQESAAWVEALRAHFARRPV